MFAFMIELENNIQSKHHCVEYITILLKEIGFQ